MSVRRTLAAALALVAATGLTTAAAVPASASPPRTGAAATALPGPLHTQGRWIVDRHGHRVKLAAVNWSGAETPAYVVGGLDERPLDALAATIHNGGFDAVRLPWSNQLVEDDPVVAPQYLSANPRLQGKTALQVLDAVIASLGRHGVMVVLDNHRSRADWCCDEDHGDGLWYTPQYSERDWLRDWTTMATRYRHAPNVVAAELRNEIRPEPQLAPGPTTATWGDGNRLTDWRAAAERGGAAVLAANRNLLVVVGGTEYQGNLTGVRHDPVRLPVAHRVVYAPHDYVFFHADADVASQHAFRASVEDRWAYLTHGPNAAPLFLSETGTCTNPNVTEQCGATDPAYRARITTLLRHTDIDWAYWPFNGTQGTGYGRQYGQPETYGLMAPDWSGYGNRTVLAAFQAVQQPRLGPPSWR